MAGRLHDHGRLDKVSMRREEGDGRLGEYIGEGVSRVTAGGGAEGLGMDNARSWLKLAVLVCFDL